MNINKKNVLKYADAYDKQYRGTADETEMKRLLKKQRYLMKKEEVED